MKKIILASAVLLFFAISISIFQMSCKKDANAQTGTNYTLPPATTSSLGGVIIGSGLSVTANGTISVSNTSTGTTQLNKILVCKAFGTYTEIWTANYDGSNYTKINISLPVGFKMVSLVDARLSPDGKYLFFNGSESVNLNIINLYSCKIDGSNLQKIISGVSGATGNTPYLRGVY